MSIFNSRTSELRSAFSKLNIPVLYPQSKVKLIHSIPLWDLRLLCAYSCGREHQIGLFGRETRHQLISFLKDTEFFKEDIRTLIRNHDKNVKNAKENLDEYAEYTPEFVDIETKETYGDDYPVEKLKLFLIELGVEVPAEEPKTSREATLLRSVLLERIPDNDMQVLYLIITGGFDNTTDDVLDLKDLNAWDMLHTIRCYIHDYDDIFSMYLAYRRKLLDEVRKYLTSDSSTLPPFDMRRTGYADGMDDVDPLKQPFLEKFAKVQINLDLHTVPQLKAMAKSRRIKGYSKYCKNKLIKCLTV